MKLFRILKRKLPIIAIFVLLLQTTGFFYCGENECSLLGEDSSVCKALLCSLFDGNGNSQQESDDNQDDCSQCTCCVSFCIHDIITYSNTLVASTFFIESSFITPPPVSLIDHIPRA